MRLITANLNKCKKTIEPITHSKLVLSLSNWYFSLGNLALLFKGTKVIYFEDFEEI